MEFSDANVSAQYDHSAVNIVPLVDSSHPPLFIGDRDSLSMVQIMHRSVKSVINAASDNHSLSKEEGVEYLNIDPVMEMVGGKQMNEAIAFIQKAHEGNEPVLVSCQTGNAQSAAIGMYWLMKVKGMSYDDAMAGMITLRPPKLRPELSVMLDVPRLLERDSNSVTVVWKALKKGCSYELQMAEKEEGTWKTLSSTLTCSFARKKNLKAGALYRFRVRFIKDQFASEWTMSSLSMSPLPSDVKQMDPVVASSVSSESATLQWSEVDGASGYMLRYRKDTDDKWTTIGKQLTSNTCKKKNLEKGKTYYFAIRPELHGEGGTQEHLYEWSVSSAPVSLPSVDSTSLAPFMAQLFPATLKSKSPGTELAGQCKVTTKGALSGKITAVYFSASWCGPCRRFTPMLAEAYSQAKAKGLPFEVVFCSADHSEEEFDSYYGGHHPWLAIEYEAHEREGMMGKFSVSGIPQLSILDAQGRFIEPNAVQTGGVNLQRVEAWCSRLTTPSSQAQAQSQVQTGGAVSGSGKQGGCCSKCP